MSVTVVGARKRLPGLPRIHQPTAFGVGSNVLAEKDSGSRADTGLNGWPRGVDPGVKGTERRLQVSYRTGFEAHAGSST